jgi:DNA-binding NtrC family response regulator
MTNVMLVGGDVALLEGLAQTLAVLGHTPKVARTMREAHDLSRLHVPLVLIVDRALATDGGAELLTTPLASGGARLLFRTTSSPLVPLLPSLQRAVLAELTLPLERHRLVALVQSVGERARLSGRTPRQTPPESRTI